MIKTLFFDVETTGLNPTTCSIVQLSGIVDIDGIIVDKFNYMMSPDIGAEISLEALAVIGKSKEEIMANQSQQSAYEQFLAMLEKHVSKYDREDKLYPAGYNVRLDLDFLQAFFKKRGNQFGTGSYQNWRAIDVMQIAHYLCYRGALNLPNYKLGTLCQYFNINIQAHDSLSDIKATRELLRALQGILHLTL